MVAKLEQNGSLLRVEYSDWASPIVPAPQKDNNLRLCGDHKVSLNEALIMDQYCLNVVTCSIVSLVVEDLQK